VELLTRAGTVIGSLSREEIYREWLDRVVPPLKDPTKP